MIIVNWNTEWASPRSPRASIIRGRIRALDPEILCLTEAYLDFWQEPGYLIACEEDAGHPIVTGRRKVLLWSKRPWRTVVDHGPGAMPPGRYIYGETGTSLGPLGVHGLCIPWAGAHVRTGQKKPPALAGSSRPSRRAARRP